MGRKDIGPLISEIYDAAVDPGYWLKVLRRLTEVFAASSAHLSVDDPLSSKGKIISFGTDASYASRYADYYVTRNILWQGMVQQSLEGILTNRMIMSGDELHRSEFYNDFLRPQDGDEILCAAHLHCAELVTNLTLWRPERHGPWQAKQIRLLAEIAPHLRRALRLNERIGPLATAHAFSDELVHRLSYGVMLVGADASLCFANRAAEAAFDVGGGLRLERGRLSALRTSDTDALRRLIAGATLDGTGGSHIIRRQDRPPLLILVVPLQRDSSPLALHRSGAMVFVRDMERAREQSLDAFADYFALTPAQTALAYQLIKGDGVAAAAVRLGISHATARTHLLRIFQKTSTKRQAELVRLMLEWTDLPMRREGQALQIDRVYA